MNWTATEVSIGRDIANDIVINDAEVSRKHARLILEADRYKIEDLNSTNGTYIDGQRLIGPHLLAIGEVIMFGDNVGVVFDGEPVDLDATVPSTIDLKLRLWRRYLSQLKAEPSRKQFLPRYR